jgi:hypothetical protein
METTRPYFVDDEVFDELIWSGQKRKSAIDAAQHSAVRDKERDVASGKSDGATQRVRRRSARMNNS